MAPTLSRRYAFDSAAPRQPAVWFVVECRAGEYDVQMTLFGANGARIVRAQSQAMVSTSTGYALAVRGWRWAASLVILIACLVVPARAADDYPLNVSLEATVKTAATTVTSVVTIRLDRLMEESRRKRATDALTFSGYANFLNELRGLPAIGVIALQSRDVNIKYAREEREGTGRRLVLIADRPLFFLTADPSRNRAGFELTVVELRYDEKGALTGRMTGAARVKPSPDGPVLNDFAEAPVQLAPRAGK